MSPLARRLVWGHVSVRLGSLLLLVTGVVMAALRYWLLCPNCGIPRLRRGKR